jgi:hypothetical protein
MNRALGAVSCARHRPAGVEPGLRVMLARTGPGAYARSAATAPRTGVACSTAVHARLTLMTLLGLLGLATLAGGFATVAAAGTTSTAPCAPRAGTIDGRRAITYCGPATVTIEVAGRTYSFQHGLCDLSRTMGGLELNVGTRVEGATGNAGRAYVSLVLAHGPSESEAFEADAGGGQLFGDSVIAQGGPLYGKGTFGGLFGAAFTGSWDCHGVIYAGP